MCIYDAVMDVQEDGFSYFDYDNWLIAISIISINIRVLEKQTSP